MTWFLTKRFGLTSITCDKVCPLPFQGWKFSIGTMTSTTSKINQRDTTEMLLKVALKPNQTNLHIQLTLNCYIFRASMRLAYKDMSLERKKQEDKLKAADPKKAEQFERLGMGFGGSK